MKIVTPNGRHPRQEFEDGDKIWVRIPFHLGGGRKPGVVCGGRQRGGWYKVLVAGEAGTQLINQGACSRREMRTSRGGRPLTVGRLRELLAAMPDDHVLTAYEGEGTGLNVHDATGETVGWIDAEPLDYSTTEWWTERKRRMAGEAP